MADRVLLQIHKDTLVLFGFRPKEEKYAKGRIVYVLVKQGNG